MSKVYISGIGGTGAFYLALYYINLKYEVYGSDITSSDRTKKLEKHDVKIFYNPIDTSHLNILPKLDLYIYSSALPDEHIELQFFKNEKIKKFEVGELYTLLVNSFKNGSLSGEERKAFLNSEIAPLFKFNWNEKKVIAVTGTDGKTTTCSMIFHMLSSLGYKAGMITTLGVKIKDVEASTGLHTTTPSSQEIFEILNSKDFDDVEFIILETTSHGLAMGRLAGAYFDVAVITNITSEHLDYHKSWENYFIAKTKIFTEHLKPGGVLVLNTLDPSFEKLKKLANEQDITVKSTSQESYGKLELDDSVNTAYNLQNANSALNALSVLFPDKVNDALESLKTFKNPKGRMEVLQNKPFSIIVDFAHTAHALENVLKNLRSKLQPSAELRVVFGCAGKRDKTKRIHMGKISGTYADVIYLAPEDPRTESLKEINRQVLAGMGVDVEEIEEIARRDFAETTLKNGKTVKVFQKGELSDRFNAIKAAIEDCLDNDILIICGKGHERSMCFGTTEYDWSDQEAVGKILQNLKS